MSHGAIVRLRRVRSGEASQGQIREASQGQIRRLRRVRSGFRFSAVGRLRGPGRPVSFYFCPRSVMLYILHWGNLPGLTYKEGQRPILHLEADLHEVVGWAESKSRPWAFTDRNAGSFYFETFRDLTQLDQLNWEHINNPDFRDPLVKESKQAEFLVFGSFPWTLVRRIGAMSERLAERVREIVSVGDHRPDVQVRTEWYY